jgi:hypothetical protein
MTADAYAFVRFRNSSLSLIFSVSAFQRSVFSFGSFRLVAQWSSSEQCTAEADDGDGKIRGAHREKLKAENGKLKFFISQSGMLKAASSLVGRPECQDFHVPISRINPVVNRPPDMNRNFDTAADRIVFVIVRIIAWKCPDLRKLV